MRLTTFALASLLVAGAAAAAPPATAAKRKPITKTYNVTAPVPDVTNNSPNARYEVCEMTLPQSFHSEPFKAPALGKLAVKLSGFTGDWDLLVLDSKGASVGAGTNLEESTPVAPTTETATVKIRKPGTTYQIIACNFSGGPTATVTYTFTFA